MDIHSKHSITFSRRLYLSVMALFLALTACFMTYQYRREKAYRADIIDTKLQTYNAFIAKNLEKEELWPLEVRVTILDHKGNVLVNRNQEGRPSQDWETEMLAESNHLDRPEVRDALLHGTGRDIRRRSATEGDEFFYSAMTTDSLIIRTALPYNHTLLSMLTADKDFLWLSIALFIILAFIYEGYTQRVGLMIESHRKKMESDLEQSLEDKSRMKRQMTQNIAHELKTPVSSIQGFLDILVEDKDMPQAQREDFLRRCHQQSTRLASILRDIGILTRIDDAPVDFEKEDCDLKDIMDNITKDLERPILEHQDQVLNQIPQNIIVKGNYSLLYSVFRNLTDNALAYAGDGITIKVSARMADDKVQVVFQDNGKGIPQEHLPFIFERFYRVDKGRSRSMGGTGLGLAIVKHAIRLHGGSIHVRSAMGGGLEFDFTLKVKQD